MYESEVLVVQGLKRCPFCGNDIISDKNMASLRIIERTKDTFGYGFKCDPYKIYFVECGKCYAKGGSAQSGYFELCKKTVTEEEALQTAIDKWNNRADQR